MTGHIFISYRHGKDRRYVERLAAHLSQHGHQVWFDKDIVQGDRWPRVIRTCIDSCAAFIVVMTPEAEQSEWVEREIDQAHQTNRPILPLLLRGPRFFTLVNVQYEDVTGGRLPGLDFMRRLQMIVPTQQFGQHRAPFLYDHTAYPTAGLPGPPIPPKPISEDRTTPWGILAVVAATLQPALTFYLAGIIPSSAFIPLSVLFGILSVLQAKEHQRKPKLAYVAFSLTGAWLVLIVSTLAYYSLS